MSAASLILADMEVVSFLDGVDTRSLGVFSIWIVEVLVPLHIRLAQARLHGIGNGKKRL